MRIRMTVPTGKNSRLSAISSRLARAAGTEYVIFRVARMDDHCRHEMPGSNDAYTNQLHGYTGLVSRAIHLACEDNFTSALLLNADELSSIFSLRFLHALSNTVSDDNNLIRSETSSLLVV